jgi:hypothetical protein
MQVTLLYLQRALLEDGNFLRDFFANYNKLPGRSLLACQAIADDDLRRSTFTGKRVSANLSEAMVPNMLLNAHQRGLISVQGDAYALKPNVLEQAFANVQCVVVGGIVMQGNNEAPADSLKLLQALRGWGGVGRVVLFPHNAQSALGAEARVVQTADDHARLVKAFAEEQTTLDLALQLAPATVAGVRNFYLP